jgi:hypothetical protein
LLDTGCLREEKVHRSGYWILDAEGRKRFIDRDTGYWILDAEGRKRFIDRDTGCWILKAVKALRVLDIWYPVSSVQYLVSRSI